MEALILFVEQYEPKSVNSRSLNTIELKGLLERIRHPDNVSLLRSFQTFVGLLITFPIFRYASSEIMVQVFRKSESLFDE